MGALFICGVQLRTKPCNAQITGKVDDYGTRRCFSEAGTEYARFSMKLDPSFDGKLGFVSSAVVFVYWFEAEEWVHDLKAGDTLMVVGTLVLRRGRSMYFVEMKCHGKESVGYDGVVVPTVTKLYEKKKRAGKARLSDGEIKT